MGRAISPSDDVTGANLVVDLSYGTWKNVFGGDPNIVGRDTQLNGRKCTIIGVMPPGFEFPPGNSIRRKSGRLCNWIRQIPEAEVRTIIICSAA